MYSFRNQYSFYCLPCLKEKKSKWKDLFSKEEENFWQFFKFHRFFYHSFVDVRIQYMWWGCCLVGQWCNVCMNDRSFLSSIHHISKFRAKKLRNDPCLRTFLESSNDKSILLMLSLIQKYAFFKKKKKPFSLYKWFVQSVCTNQSVQKWSICHDYIGFLKLPYRRY